MALDQESKQPLPISRPEVDLLGPAELFFGSSRRKKDEPLLQQPNEKNNRSERPTQKENDAENGTQQLAHAA
ncbi:MAG TPA: hypothetical protein VFR10_14425 [bacterium]|nr:hypothetical protein [bacterium]